MKHELDALRSWCRAFRGPFPTQTEVRQHAKQVENAARRLLDLIDPQDRNGAWRDVTGSASDWSLADLMSDPSLPSRPSLGTLRNGLQYMRDLSHQLQQPMDQTSDFKQLVNVAGSKFDSCVNDLVRIYETQFERDAGCKRHADGEPYGEFLDFVEFCINQLNFLGDERFYQKETIVRSLSKLRSRHKRLSPEK